VPLATPFCKNLPAENTQRELSRPKPTRVAVPIEEEEEDTVLYLTVTFGNRFFCTPATGGKWSSLEVTHS
jgi:hypothetical protein